MLRKPVSANVLVYALTGPGPGKIPLNAVVELILGAEPIVVQDAEVYLHLKGWSRAFVTHIDVEAPIMNEYIARPRSGFYAKMIYRPLGLIIEAARALKPCVIRIREAELFPKVFSIGEESWCFVGGKYGGIYIGFRKMYIERMESIARERWGIEPKSSRARR